eukprot:symbB.v1.2.022593.t1/scaffold2013.1/size94568/2
MKKGVREEILQSVLHLAACSPSLSARSREAVFRLLTKEVGPYNTGSTAAGKLEVLNLLGESALLLALRTALTEVNEDIDLGAVRVLLEGKANPNTADKPMDETPLMEAVAAKSVPAVHLLLDFRADPLRIDGLNWQMGVGMVDF